MGDGRVEGILSIDVSDWECPGRRFGKVASRCTREEIKQEGLGPAQGPSERRSRAGAARREPDRLAPRPGDRVPQPERRDERRAAAGQHRRLVGRSARRHHPHPHSLPRLGLRAHLHRPRDHGGRERSGAASCERDSRVERVAGGTLRRLAAERAERVRPRTRAGSDSMAAVSTGRQAAVAGWRARATGADRTREHRADAMAPLLRLARRRRNV